MRNDGVTRRHSYELYRQHCNRTVRSTFFTERAVNVWNALPSDEVDFSSLNEFRRSVINVDLSQFLVDTV